MTAPAEKVYYVVNAPRKPLEVTRDLGRAKHLAWVLGGRVERVGVAQVLAGDKNAGGRR